TVTEEWISSWRQSRCFIHMQQIGLQPDQFTFASMYSSLCQNGSFGAGYDIHQSIMKRGILSDVVVATSQTCMQNGPEFE
ncbi:hypothetical protein KI387_039255, partial [Taxus chinensis]